MIFNDRIHGRVVIKEPVIVELIKSPSLQRLKKIDQIGYPVLFGRGFSRFEHSLGVFLLLRRFNAPLEEQIAGLIHDVSHTVFSHCIDYALDEESEKTHKFQDDVFRDFVKNSEIPSILEKHGIDVDYVLDEKNFPLKEKPLPDLCADRIDYTLRTAVVFEEITREEALNFLDKLKVIDDNWVFEDFDTAKKFAELFRFMNVVYYASLKSAVMLKSVGNVIKYALKRGYISREDLFTTDNEVLKKIRKFRKVDKNLDLLLRRMEGKTKFKIDRKNYNVHTFCKSRIVDPLFKHGNSIKRLSEVDKKWAEIIEIELKPKEYFIRFFDRKI